MELRLVVVGKDRHDPLCQAAAEYLQRIRHYHPTSLIEVREEPLKGTSSVDRVRAAEAQRLRDALQKGDRVIALDETGRALDSRSLAHQIGRWAEESRARTCFLIGGPSGLDPALVSSADATWSLSKLTLPHRLARLLLAEQLYRACTILRGEPYHK